MTRTLPKRVAGFTLMEALVALAIATLCLIPLMSLQRAFVDGQRRHEAALQAAETQKNALVLLREVNPSDTPEGSLTLPPDMTVSWTSEALTDPKTSTGYPVGDGPYTVILYRLNAQVAKGDQPVGVPFSVERVGWSLGQTAAAPQAPNPAPGSGQGRRGQ